MAQKSGFFNALNTSGEYDRKYNANDYSDNLAVVISNGVLRSTADDLKVTASGLETSVAVGRAWIEGHWYKNDAVYTFPAVTPPAGGSRYDRVMLRYDNTLNQREISLIYVEGTASSTPVKPSPIRSDDIYDLVLADIFVKANASTVGVFDRRSDSSLCGWVYSTSGDGSFFKSLDSSFVDWFEEKKGTLSSVTLFKRYNWRTVLSSATKSVAFSIPQYDAETCFVEVYVNGILETLTTDYTVSGSVLTFSGTLTAGTEVEVKCYKSIDGTGIQTVSGEITELQNRVNAMEGNAKFAYVCTGLNDNVSLSQIAQAFINGSYVEADVTAAAATFLSAIGGNTYLATLPTDAQMTVSVIGTLGATTAYSGDGTADSRYKYFSLGTATTTPKKIVFDFAKCSKINISCAASTSNIIFFGSNIYVKNANVEVSGAGNSCVITMAAGNTMLGALEFTDCRLKAVATGKCIIAQYGTFTNCILHVKSATDNGYCFDGVSSGIVRVIGGTLYAYTGTTSKVGSVFNIDSAQSRGAIIAQGINCPTVAQSSYYQNNLCVSNGGMTYISGVASALPSGGTASKRSINGQINF